MIATKMSLSCMVSRACEKMLPFLESDTFESKATLCGSSAKAYHSQMKKSTIASLSSSNPVPHL